jgi:hypothetical protein
MNRRHAFYAVIIVAFALPFPAKADVKKFQAICGGQPPAIQCLRTHFDALYEADFEKLWDAYETYKKRALKCRRPQAMADFLSLANSILINAEVSEGFAEDVEKAIIGKTKCFLEGAILLDDSSLRALIKYFVATPIYHEPDELTRPLEKYRQIGRYNRFMRLYFKALADGPTKP